MGRKKFWIFLIAIFGGFMLCSPSVYADAGQLNARIQSGELVQKVDNFMVIIDASQSMIGRMDQAVSVVEQLNQTIPDIKLNAALRSFGKSVWPFSKRTDLIYGLTNYTKQGFSNGLSTVSWAGGNSPLDKALDAAGADLKGAKGQIAMIIVTDGEEMSSAPVASAGNLKLQFGNRLCIYTIQIGASGMGKVLLDQIAKAMDCGSSIASSQVLSDKGMTEFVENVFLAKISDSDGDGVPNAIDQCPGTPTGVKVDAKGCPLDTDGDGVYDYLDQCPDTPAGAKVDEKGCALDTDRDGVPDYRDRCPDTPMGSRVDEYGCTIKQVRIAPKQPGDADGDGVLDDKDKCPGTPAFAKVNISGCWIIPGVRFDSGKWDIKSSSYAELDNVVTVLKENPDLKVEVQGHTDNVGSAKFNQNLSEKRARSVMEYFLKKGVSQDRLTSEGYGFSRPATTNDTPEGRAINRRVELSPVNK